MSEQREPYQINTEPPPTPMAWLWRELEQRLGKEAAEELHQGFIEQQRIYQARHNLKEYRRQLPGLEWNLRMLRRQGKDTTALERRIAMRKERLMQAGLEAMPWEAEELVHLYNADPDE